MQYFVAIKSKKNSSGALEAARRYSPNIEIVDENTLVFDLTGSKAREAPRIAAELREKFEAVSVSKNLAAALLLATWSREGFKVQGSKFKVPEEDSPRNTRKTRNGKEYVRESGSSSEQISTACVSERPSEPPAVAGGEDESTGGRESRCSSEKTQNTKLKTQNPPSTQKGTREFKVQSSKFKVCDVETGAKDAGSSQQTQNTKLKTQNLLQEAFKVGKSEYRAGPLITSGEEFNARADKDRRRKASRFRVQGSKFKVRSAGVESEKAGLGQQTLNVEPGTLNAPKAPTLNVEPGTLNPQALNRLPMEAISRKQEFLELMDSWAVHDLGTFASLPEDGMVERFGLEILELCKQAAGEAFRAPNWNVREDKFFWEKELEGAIETIEPLNFVLSKGVAQIFRNLDYAGLSTQAAKITLRGRGKEKIYRVRIVFPTKNQKLWIRQIVTKIELDTPRFNIGHVGIEFRSTKPRTVQNKLYSGVILEPENLNLIVSKLKKVVGLEKIGLPKLRDSWSDPFYMTEDLSALIADSEFKVEDSRFRIQDSDLRDQGSSVEESGFRIQDSDSSEQTRNQKPGTRNSQVESARVPEGGSASGVSSSEFQVPSSSEQTRNQKPETRNSLAPRPPSLTSVFYYLPQPVQARLFFEGGEPKAILIKGKREMVRTSGGPWRKDAEWYRASKWQRDEWDVETETGAVYRVFTDKNGAAFVDGGYD